LGSAAAAAAAAAEPSVPFCMAVLGDPLPRPFPQSSPINIIGV
jgi:hypothetical protein